MSALHVVVRPRPEKAPSAALASMYGLFDLVIDGVNVTARVGEAQALPFLADLAAAVVALATGRKHRVSLPLYSEPQIWELGLLRDGEQVQVAVFSGGPQPQVSVFGRRVALKSLIKAVQAALKDVRGQAKHAPAHTRTQLAGVAQSLGRVRIVAQPPAKRYPVGLRTSVAGLTLTVEAQFVRRAAQDSPAPSQSLERADLHGLLVEGSVAIAKKGLALRFDGAQPFIVAEQLLTLAREIWRHGQARRSLFRRFQIGAAQISARLAPGATRVELQVSGSDVDFPKRKTLFAELEFPDLVGLIANFADRLEQAFVDGDAEQLSNLRLRALADLAQALSEQITSDAEERPLTNPSPEQYRCHSMGPRRARGVWEHGAKMRFMARWVATVPHIDLRATFLCGDRLLVGSGEETACIERNSGAVLWRTPTLPAACVVAPSGLVRIEPHGHVICHELETGAARFELDIRPRTAGRVSGSVVDSPGLPRQLMLAEGDRQVTAVDLVTGQTRWRYTGSRPAALRLRRIGRLLIACGGENTMVALDVATGEVVWRDRSELPYSGDLTFDRDSVFALAGSTGRGWQLRHLDAFTGELRWSAELDERPLIGRSPLITTNAVSVAVADEHGAGVKAYDKSTGEQLWSQAPGLVSETTAWLAVDDSIMANSTGGVFLCLDANTGTLRFNHVFPNGVEADQPRRLEPVLRSGALFVPQHRVFVVRPKDGDVIGVLPDELIPDLIRVDERCDVYVAEESGHVAAFGVGPQLTLVK